MNISTRNNIGRRGWKISLSKIKTDTAVIIQYFEYLLDVLDAELENKL